MFGMLWPALCGALLSVLSVANDRRTPTGLSDGQSLAGTPYFVDEDATVLMQRPLRLNRSNVQAMSSPDESHELHQPVTLGPMVAAQGLRETPSPDQDDLGHKIPKTAAEASGVTSNAKGDSAAFLTALFTNGCSVAGIWVALEFIRFVYPTIYANNVKEGLAPRVSIDGTLGWLRASWATTNEQVEDCAGLDQAMLLQFANLCMRIMLQVGFPLLFICGPLNYMFGGKVPVSHLSDFSMGHVVNHHPWLYWVHSLFVWYVVVTVTQNLHDAQRAFLPRRFRWLRSMPEPRSTTVLVEGIPADHRSDKELNKFFVEMFSEDKVKSVYIAKDTSTLLTLLAQREYLGNTLKETEHEWEKVGKDEASRPKMLTYTGFRVDSIEYYTSQVQGIEKRIHEERQRILTEADFVGGVNGSSGFVTFASRSDAEVAQSLNYTPDDDEWMVSTPPGPESLRWPDLATTQEKGKVQHAIGYGLVAGLYVAYLPLVIGIAVIAAKVKMGPLQPVWEGLVPSLGLSIMVAYLPTFLILIFKTFFVLKDEAWAQHKLHNYYFWFNLTFVILVTAVGGSVVSFVRTLMTNPMGVFVLLGATMPGTTHFYMNFVVLQWIANSLNMLRYVPLAKFLAFRKIYGDDVAKQMAEPEDQDYYGIGSRSAQWTTHLLIGIIFGTLCPPMNVLVFVNFLICRLEYGYLIPFAETRKADLGGAFFVQKLHHVFVGLIIYCIMMVGVLSGRAPTQGPGAIAAASLVWVFLSWRRFRHGFEWEKLPFSELVREELVAPKQDSARYVQQELEDEGSLAKLAVGERPA